MQRTFLQIQKETKNNVYTYKDLVKDSEGITNALDENYETRTKRVQAVFFHDVLRIKKEEEKERLALEEYKKRFKGVINK
jgi:uncharacterized protein YqkB